MSNDKLRSDALQEQLDRLRDDARRKARRRQSAADRVVFASLLLFLLVSLFAAGATWEAARMPAHTVLAIALLAAVLQRLLGLHVRRGRLLSAGGGTHLWWWCAVALGGALVLVAG